MPDAPQQGGGGEGLASFPPNGELFTLTDFKGINTQSPRMSIDDQEMSWDENLFPIGKGNLRTMWGKGTSMFTAVGGRTVVMTYFFHVSSTQYGIAFLDNGTAIQFKTSDGTQTVISATPGTFYNGGNLPSVVTFGNSGVLILSSTSSNGYYAWDTVTLYSPGGTAPTWLSGLTTPIVYTGNTHTTITVDNLSGITGLQTGMSVSGSGVQPATTLATIVSTSSITLSLATTTSLTATPLTFNWFMPMGISGTTIEIFQNRVWTANGNVVTFAAAGNGTTFAASNGGGTFTLTDSFTQSVTSLKQANGYLYIIADSGINYIGNVQTAVNTTTGTVTTTFNNLNTDPQVGSPWVASVTPFGRALMLANTSGIYAMFGGSAEKVSSKLDGLFATATLPLTGINNIPSGGVATIFGIRVFFLLVTAVDPFTNTSRPIMCCWDGNKWFISSQEVNCTYIATSEQNSQLNVWGTDGTNIFPMFATPSTALTKKGKTKLWSGKSQLIDKQFLGAYFEGFDNSGSGYAISITVDNEFGSQASSITNQGGQLVFVNNTGGIIQFVNNSSGSILWSLVTAIDITGVDVNSAYGKLLGYSFSSTSQDFTLVETNILYKNYRFYR